MVSQGAIREYLEYLEVKCDEEGTLTEPELGAIYEALESTDLKTISLAAIIITGLEAAAIQPVIGYLPNYTVLTKLILIPLLSCLEYKEPYEQIISLFIEETDKRVTLAIQTTFQRTDYPVFPLILNRLSHDPESQEKVLALLQSLGFKKAEPYLSLFPQVPFEKQLRQIYGDQNIDHIYKEETDTEI